MTKLLTGRPRPRILVAVGCLLAALVVALLPVPPVTPAAAADDNAPESAVTKTGKKGKYDDFSELQVTVHETKNLRSQSVHLTWQGGAPTTTGGYRGNYLQIMQCWGDDPDGPDRDQCVFGAGGAISGRSTYSREVSPNSDPDETRSDFVPFRPATGEDPTAELFDYTYFGPLDTNEENANRIYPNGTGEVEFEVQDGNEADYLGCGVNTAPAGSTPTPRHCWLVVVPRGMHDARGQAVDPETNSTLNTSPLSATNWAQRMVFRLDFLPLDNFCPEGRAERSVAGSELVVDAVDSWQPKLCTTTDSTFFYSPESEEAARGSVAATTSDSPLLGVTIDPVAQQDGQPSVVHAPLAVSGLAIAFFVESPASGAIKEMKLTPRLVAKMLTHSYVRTVPWNKSSPTPEHLRGNPYSYFDDQEFKELNPQFAEFAEGEQLSGQLSLMVPSGDSDTTRLLWDWLQSDKAARDFLSGQPDPWGMRVNPYFQELNLAESASTSDYPKNDPTKAIAIDAEDLLWLDEKPTYGITALDPYTENLHDGAVRTRRGNNNNRIVFDSTALNKNEFKNLAGTRITAMAVVDVASAERYGLSTAALRNADGRFVKPATDTLLAGVGAMQPSPDNAAVLKPAPARAKGQAYPLTAVTYAAASVNQGAADRKAYADFIRYAAGAGQTPGLSVGELPYGYAPLPDKLRKQADAAADDLQRGQVPDDSGTPNPDDPGGGGAGGLTGGGNAGGTSSGTSAGGVSGGAGNGDANTGAATSEASARNESPAPSPGAQENVAQSGITPGDVLGVIRWILLVVLFVGGAAGLAGPIMLRLAQRRTP
ncbi:hypothetical protein ACWEQC_45435 [Streptomyces shenzhenensis]